GWTGCFFLRPMTPTRTSMVGATLRSFPRHPHFERSRVMAMLSNGRLSSITNINHSGGYCFTAPTPDETPHGDDLILQDHSSLRLFEDDAELGPAHSLHNDILTLGGGRFSHWGRWLMFSSSDGSDPRTNGRSYRMLYFLRDSRQTG